MGCSHYRHLLLVLALPLFPANALHAEDRVVPFAREAAAEERIYQALEEPTSVHFLEVPLPDAIEHLALTHKIAIRFDRPALKDAGRSIDVPMVFALDNVTLRSTLDLMLPPEGMSYIIRDEVLLITSLDVARKHQYERVYELPEFCIGKEEKLIEVLTTTVSPDLWTQNGGEFSAVTIDGLLTIRANRHVHDASLMLLAKLRQQAERRTR